MTITVLDTAAGMDAVLSAEERDRPEVLRDMLAPMKGMFRYFPGEVDLVAMHAMSFGFPLDRKTEEMRAAVDQFKKADAWARIQQALDDAATVQADAVPGACLPDVTVLLMLGNPDDEYFMGPARGLSGNGSMTGYLSLTLWPTGENLARLEAAAVHELHHNLRYAPGGVVWDPASVRVGEQIISEGLADAFARQLYGPELGYTPIGTAHLEDDEVMRKVISGLDVGGMENFTAWVLGDEAAVRFGGVPAGVPAGGGYAVGNRLVDAYLSASGKSAADALYAPSGDVIEVALSTLPFQSGHADA